MGERPSKYGLSECIHVDLRGLKCAKKRREKSHLGPVSVYALSMMVVDASKNGNNNNKDENMRMRIILMRQKSFGADSGIRQRKKKRKKSGESVHCCGGHAHTTMLCGF